MLTNVEETLLDTIIEEKIIRRDCFIERCVKAGYHTNTVNIALVKIIELNLIFIKDGYIYHNQQENQTEIDKIEELLKAVYSNKYIESDSIAIIEIL